MSGHSNINLTVLGLKIAFRPGADLERGRQVAEYLEERYAAQKLSYRGMESKDILLTLLALGLADELLQLKSEQEQTEDAVNVLIEKIKKSL